MTEDSRSGILITVFSTASAVGKTLLSINLAAGLAQYNHKVCVVDFDFQFGDICNYLHISPQKTIYDVQAAMEQHAGQVNYQEAITLYHGGGVAFDVLAAPLKLEEAYNIATPAASAILSGLRTAYDYVVVDTTATFSDLNLAVMDMSTIITFVGIVDFIPTIKNMKIGYDTMRSIGYDKNKIRFILNRSNSKTAIELQDVEQLLEEEFYHVVPNDFAAANASIHQGIPIIGTKDKNALSHSLQELAAKYTNRLQERQGSGGGALTAWVKRLFT